MTIKLIYRRQILTYKDGPSTVRVKFKTSQNTFVVDDATVIPDSFQRSVHRVSLSCVLSWGLGKFYGILINDFQSAETGTISPGAPDENCKEVQEEVTANKANDYLMGTGHIIPAYHKTSSQGGY